MNIRTFLLTSLVAMQALTVGISTTQAATPEEASRLQSSLTPLGAERAGNAEGTIPAWDGGNTTPAVGFKNGGKRGDPFASDMPLFTITAQNMDQYADKLSDGTKAMLRKYPNTYRLDVYPTRRTAAAPQWVYDNSFANATRAHLEDSSTGPRPVGAYGGVPFPIPKTGAEVMWNHLLRWRGTAWALDFRHYLITANGNKTLVTDATGDQMMPYYLPDGSADDFNGDYWLIRLVNSGPPLRAGEAITGRENINARKTRTWVYLTGQRRVRKLPNSCCDTPTPAAAGVMTFDEISTFTGRLDRFNWTLKGKKELFVPYNTNASLQPSDPEEIMGAHHLEPKHIRWELHRVWEVEATLKDRKRHQMPRSVYYIDEDSWIAVLGDRWDANKQLSRVLWSLPMTMPDIPAVVAPTYGFYDLVSGSWFAGDVYTGKSSQYRIMPPFRDDVFTADAMAGEGIR